MNKFSKVFIELLNDNSISEEELNLINEVVIKEGWYSFGNYRGEVEVDYIGNELENEKELREESSYFCEEVFDNVIYFEENVLIKVVV